MGRMAGDSRRFGDPIVGWYDPGQLAKTEVEVLLSSIFGRYADHRLIESLTPKRQQPYDHRKGDDGSPRTSIWVDYVGDVGDDWDSTYAVARLGAT